MSEINSKNKLAQEQREELLNILQTRFEKNINRHVSLEWSKIQAKLETQPEKLWSLYQMELTGGEPDCVGYDAKTGDYIFYDCAAESPKERRSLCYDRQAPSSCPQTKVNCKTNT